VKSSTLKFFCIRKIRSGNSDPFVEVQEFLILLLRCRNSWSFCWGAGIPDHFGWGSGVSDPFVKNLIQLVRLKNFWSIH